MRMKWKVANTDITSGKWWVYPGENWVYYKIMKTHFVPTYNL